MRRLHRRLHEAAAKPAREATETAAGKATAGISTAAVTTGAVTAGAGYLSLAPEHWPLSLRDRTGLRGMPVDRPFELPDFSVPERPGVAAVGLGRGGPVDLRLRKAIDALGGIERFVAPGERVLVRERADDPGYGDLLRVLEAHPGRREAPCPHFGPCGGCQLQHLAPSAQLAFQWSPCAKHEATGPERVHLSFSANPGQSMQPLTKVASGGERSRVMLSLKAALTRHLEVPTLILDEIDAGVSGDVASRMADLIATISGSTQVITISHLPQVAGKADHHFRVFKEEEDGRAHTGMTPLDEHERVEELAAMLSGETIGDSARAQARALMG